MITRRGFLISVIAASGALGLVAVGATARWRTALGRRLVNWLVTSAEARELGREYDTLVTADDVVNGRPHPDMIQLCMKNTGIEDSSTVLKAGDSTIDIEEGTNTGCGITVGVTTGAQTREQLATANPTLILDNLADILPYL